MKTTEQMVQIRTLKSLIAELVETHKSTKKIARISTNDPKYAEITKVTPRWVAQSNDLQESAQLFVLYTAYYILRHDVNKEEYIKTVQNQLREEKRNRSYHLRFFGYTIKNGWSEYGDLTRAVDASIEALNKYIDAHKDEVDK